MENGHMCPRTHPLRPHGSPHRCLVQYKIPSFFFALNGALPRNAFLLGLQYLAFEAFPIIFMEKHGFSMQMTGLTFLGIAIGFLLGVATTPYWNE
jgi:type III secretory pathway component EscT